MSFDAKAYLEKFGGDAEAALTALQKDRLRATRGKNALLEQLGLSSDEDADHTDAVKKLNAELKAYKALGEPAEIAARLELGNITRDALSKLEADPNKLAELVKAIPQRLLAAESEVQALKQSTTVRDVADAYGLNAKVLDKLLAGDNLTLEFDASKKRQVERAGKKEEVAGVATLQIDGKPVELSSHIGAAWADFAPALSATVSTTQTNAVPVGGGKSQQKPQELADLERRKLLEYGGNL